MTITSSFNCSKWAICILMTCPVTVLKLIHCIKNPIRALSFHVWACPKLAAMAPSTIWIVSRMCYWPTWSVAVTRGASPCTWMLIVARNTSVRKTPPSRCPWTYIMATLTRSGYCMTWRRRLWMWWGWSKGQVIMAIAASTIDSCMRITSTWPSSDSMTIITK